MEHFFFEIFIPDPIGKGLRKRNIVYYKKGFLQSYFFNEHEPEETDAGKLLFYISPAIIPYYETGIMDIQ